MEWLSSTHTQSWHISVNNFYPKVGVSNYVHLHQPVVARSTIFIHNYTYSIYILHIEKLPSPSRVCICLGCWFVCLTINRITQKVIDKCS